ncbi:MAG TPA: hypothetical protein VEL07_02200 [Planctomycetota bacterium]|nr:hypothetical protein [Planctomycetota bacterium]
MLDRGRIADYLATKARLAAAISDAASGFQPSMRERSEGLARSCSIDGELWTYSTTVNGYSFSSPDGALSVTVSPDAGRNACFTSDELANWMRAGGGHDNITAFVVDNWLMRAEMEQAVERAPDQRGCWRLPG